MDNYTPESIAFIYQHQVFVFGSNMNGAHIVGVKDIELYLYKNVNEQAVKITV